MSQPLSESSTTCNFHLTPELNLGIFVAANRHPESGGGGVSVWQIFNTVFTHYQIDKAPLFEVPDQPLETDVRNTQAIITTASSATPAVKKSLRMVLGDEATRSR
ncbi:MAG: hypothetical protein AAFW00_25995 [Bacteroidota bacterium]